MIGDNHIKKQYVPPKIEIIKFSVENIMTASASESEDHGDIESGGDFGHFDED